MTWHFWITWHLRYDSNQIGGLVDGASFRSYYITRYKMRVERKKTVKK